MAEIGHKVRETLTSAIRSSTTFAAMGTSPDHRILGSELDGSSEYILIAYFGLSGSDISNDAFELQIAEDTVGVLAQSNTLNEPRNVRVQAGVHCGFIDKFTTAVTPNNYHIEGRSDGTETISLAGSHLVMLKLDDLDAADWKYAADDTGDTTLTDVFEDGVSITLGVGDWDIYAFARWDTNSVADSFIMRVNFDGTALQKNQQKGSDTSDRRCLLVKHTVNVPSGTKVAKIQYALNSGATSHDLLSTRIFALRLDAFEDHAFNNKASNTTVSPHDVRINRDTLTHTSDTAATRTWFVSAGLSHDVASVQTRLQSAIQNASDVDFIGAVNATATDDIPEAVCNGNGDENWTVIFGELTGHADATDLDLELDILDQDNPGNGVINDSSISAFTWELAAGGTVFFQTNTGGLTPSGVTVKDTLKALAGLLTPSGALTTIRQYFRTFVGSLTPSGAMIKEAEKSLVGVLTPSGSVTKETQKSLVGSLTLSGVLAAVRTAFQAVLGALTPSGTLVKQTQKVVAGTLAPVGTLIKKALKVLAGALTPSGLATGVKTAVITITGAMTPSGALVKRTLKSLAGSLTPSGVLTRTIAYARTIIGALTPTGILAKRTLKVLAGALTPSGVLTSIRTFVRTIIGSLTPSGTLTTTRQYFRTFVGSLTPVGSIAKKTLKFLVGLLAPFGGAFGSIKTFGTYKTLITDSRIILGDQAIDTKRYSDQLLLNILNRGLHELSRYRPDAFYNLYVASDLNVPEVVLTNPGADQVIWIDDFAPELQFYGPLITYIVGMAELIEDEYVNSGRVAKQLARFYRDILAA